MHTCATRAITIDGERAVVGGWKTKGFVSMNLYTLLFIFFGVPGVGDDGQWSDRWDVVGILAAVRNSNVGGAPVCSNETITLIYVCKYILYTGYGSAYPLFTKSPGPPACRPYIVCYFLLSSTRQIHTYTHIRCT